MDDTIVLLWGDHGWHLGEHGIWGKHALFEESLRSPLIIAHTSLPRQGEATHSMVETLDVFPTLCGLAGLPLPAGLHGRSLEAQLKDQLRGIQVLPTQARLKPCDLRRTAL